MTGQKNQILPSCGCGTVRGAEPSLEGWSRVLSCWGGNSAPLSHTEKRNDSASPGPRHQTCSYVPTYPVWQSLSPPSGPPSPLSTVPPRGPFVRCDVAAPAPHVSGQSPEAGL